MRLRSSLAAAVALVLVVVVAPEATGKGGTVITSCGQTVTTNAVLGQDLFCNGDGIVVGAAKITINLNGHRLFGDGDPGDKGVSADGCCDNVTVENGVIRDFDVGIFANDVHFFLVKNVVVSGNGLNAIRETVGFRNSIQSSTASGNLTGIDITGGAYLSVTSSTASGNALYGVADSGVGDKIRSVTASGNATGILVEGANASVTSSTAIGNTFDGIVATGDSVTLKGNTADGNGFDTTIGPLFDFRGFGISALGVNPSGKNTAQGNDNDAECDPSYLC